MEQLTKNQTRFQGVVSQDKLGRVLIYVGRPSVGAPSRAEKGRPPVHNEHTEGRPYSFVKLGHYYRLLVQSRRRLRQTQAPPLIPRYLTSQLRISTVSIT